MSHLKTGYTYPQPIKRGLSLCHPRQVREDGDDYDTGCNDNRDTLLARAEALTWLLQESDNPPEHATRITAMMLLELIQQAREANEKVWEQSRKRERNRT